MTERWITTTLAEASRHKAYLRRIHPLVTSPSTAPALDAARNSRAGEGLLNGPISPPLRTATPSHHCQGGQHTRRNPGIAFTMPPSETIAIHHRPLPEPAQNRHKPPVILPPVLALFPRWVPSLTLSQQRLSPRLTATFSHWGFHLAPKTPWKWTPLRVSTFPPRLLCRELRVLPRPLSPPYRALRV